VTAVKDLDHYLLVGFSDADQRTHYSFLEREHPESRLTRQELDVLRRHPAATEVSVNGLTQDTFEYLIAQYGRQLKVINFWKCPLVRDLTALESLPGVEYIVYFWNQKAEQLWDLSRNTSLKGIGLDDFNRIHDLSPLASAPALEELHVGNKVWNKCVLDTLEPIGRCSKLRSLDFNAKKIVDDRIEPLAHLAQLERLEFPAHQFTDKQVAWLKARLPETIHSQVLGGHWTIGQPIEQEGKNLDTLIIGKRKVRLLDSKKDRAILDRHIHEFNALHRWFREHPEALPEDYDAG